MRELHELHHRAGWPSLRALAAAAGCSPTTVSAAFSAPRLPTWGLLELLVDEMAGDVDRFHSLWLAAGAPAQSVTRPAVVGRVAEMDLVRRHARRPGLLLIEGEPGIGKSALLARVVDELRTEPGTIVACGHALPLSAHEPWLPLADALNDLAEHAPREVSQALEALPAYVADELARVAPGLVPQRLPHPTARPSRSGAALLSALRALLTQIAAKARLVLFVEDLHWADEATLEALDYLLVHQTPVALVGTWRLEDRGPADVHDEWRRRVIQAPNAAVLELKPLSRAETADLLALLLEKQPTAEQVDQVYRRSQGQPLFTEQLVSQGSTGALPPVLTELLDRGLADLDSSAWRLVLTLGVAERPLVESVLRRSAGISVDALADSVRRLLPRRLIAVSPSGELALRHPLLAEAAQRRATLGELGQTHRHLALALAEQPEPSSAEIAEHWAGADDVAEELTWRLRAGAAAEQRLAMREAARQWQQALDLWPAGAATAGDPPLRRGRVLVAALDALPASDVDQALRLAADGEEHLAELTVDEVALLYQRKGDLLAAVGRSDQALGYLHWALRLYDDLPPSAEHIDAFERLEGVLGGLGQRQEAASVATEALNMARRTGDTRRTRLMLGLVAWHQAAGGDLPGASESVREAMTVDLEEPDPFGDIELAADVTDLLLRTGASCTQVVEVGAKALSVADQWGLSTFGTSLVRANSGIALLRAGHTQAALDMVAPATQGPPDPDAWVAHLVRADAEIAHGALDLARERLDLLRRLPAHSLAIDAERVVAECRLALWEGRPDDALSWAMDALDIRNGTSDPDTMWLLLETAARAAADKASDSEGVTEKLRRIAVRSRGGTDAAVRARQAAFDAELARAAGSLALGRWVDVATLWDRLGRPHDASYARWRAAQAATASSRYDTAQRLIRRATRDASEHRLLLHSLRATNPGANRPIR